MTLMLVEEPWEDMPIGRRVRTLRKRGRFRSMAQFCAAMDPPNYIGRSRLGDIESGSEPRYTELEKIAAAAGTSIGVLVEKLPPPDLSKPYQFSLLDLLDPDVHTAMITEAGVVYQRGQSTMLGAALKAAEVDPEKIAIEIKYERRGHEISQREQRAADDYETEVAEAGDRKTVELRHCDLARRQLARDRKADLIEVDLKQREAAKEHSVGISFREIALQFLPINQASAPACEQDTAMAGPDLRLVRTTDTTPGPRPR